jgi:hypothetical protein
VHRAPGEVEVDIKSGKVPSKPPTISPPHDGWEFKTNRVTHVQKIRRNMIIMDEVNIGTNMF